jgi:hypothetical protein
MGDVALNQAVLTSWSAFVSPLQAGYLGYHEQQSLKKALLQRQQELEQSGLSK